MYFQRNSSLVFLRIDPGEELVQCLADLAIESHICVGAIVSGVGMLKNPQLGFFNVSKDAYDIINLEGVFDLSSVCGNITWRARTPVPHVHVILNDSSLKTKSGHLLRAACHITMEIFIHDVSKLKLRRAKQVGAPATRIVPKS